MMHQHKKILVFDKLRKRLRYKQSTELKYHSIPKSDLSSKKSSEYSRLIKLSNNSKTNITYNLRYVSYSIPLLCIMLLLGLGVISFNPVTPEETFAIEDKDSSQNTKMDESTKQKSNEAGTQETENVFDSSSDNADNGDTKKETDATDANLEDLISLQASDPVISMSITNLEMAATQVQPGGIAYREHNVTVNTQDVSHYSLSISYAEENGAMRLTQDKTVFLKNATNTTMTNMPEDSWGFAWSDSINSDVANLTYYGMPQLGTYATNIETGLLESTSPANYAASFTKKLVFGAKFSSKAFPGAYHTSALLSLAASPKFTAGYWLLPNGQSRSSGILTMQSMTADVCNQVSTPADAESVPLLILKDTRGGGYTNDDIDNSYVIGKLSDGNCWMLQNFNLTNKTITSADSDMTSGEFTISASSNANAFGYGGQESYVNAVYYPYESDISKDTNKYGAYYTWNVAAAGTSGDVTTEKSVCAKGWQLPSSNIFSRLKATHTPQYYSNYTNANLGLNDEVSGYLIGNGFFSEAGSIAYRSFGGVGDSGHYWGNSTSSWGSGATKYYNASGMYFSSKNSTEPAVSGTLDRTNGHSIRCVSLAN